MTKLISNIGVLISFLAILTVAYLSVLQIYFLYMDDYFYVRYDTFLDQIRSARFLNYFIFHDIFSYIRSSPTIESGVRVIRFIGIIGIALLAYVIFTIFKTYRFKTKHAFVIGILICTLPPIQVSISWVQGVPWIYSAVLSALSALLMFKVVFKENSGKISHTVIVVLSAVIIQISALCMYQPAAMIFWAMALIPLTQLTNKDLTTRWHKPYIIYFSVGFVSLSIYFFIVKIVNHFMQLTTLPRGAMIDPSMIKVKAYWFLTNPIKNSLNLWNISPTRTLGAIVAVIILAGLALGLKQAISLAIKKRNFTLLWNHFQKLFLIFCILPLSFLPNLLVIESNEPYRTLFALETAICILLFISLMNIGEFIKSELKLPDNFNKIVMGSILTILTVFVVYNSHSNVKKHFAELHSLELHYVKNIIQEYGISNLSDTRIIYLRDHGKRYHFVKNSPYEFGYPMSNAPDYSIYIVKFVLFELGINSRIRVISIPADAPHPEDSNAMIIDLAKLGFILDERLKN